METQYVERIVLIGPTGSGKTTVGAQVAALLGWAFVDTDDLVARAAGASIPELFAREGEARFREREHAALRAALESGDTVIATGAGIVERPEHRDLMRARARVVALAVTSEIAWRRIAGAAAARKIAPEELRPMLADATPLARLYALHERRHAWYACADETLVCDSLTPEATAARIVASITGRGLLAPAGAATEVTSVSTASGGSYDAVVAWGGLAALGERLTALRLPRRLHVVADAAVADLYAPALVLQLEDAGFDAGLLPIPSGEASKSRAQLDAIHDWLIERRAERAEAVIALGGGVIGDLAGFAAATYLRGVPLVQVPTSLLAQVDASIGGKTAINHPRGKNLIGAFYPPRLVVADPATLLTLPDRQRTEGWAEVVKHGVALDAAYFETLEREAAALLRMRPAELTEAVARSVALKAEIVAGDEREREGGRRALLNYGHTLGHALEAVTGYGILLHGEAVAIGMAFAARLGQRIGVTPPEVVTRQEALLARLGLPVRAAGVTVDALLRATLWDKKIRGGRVRWVLPVALGEAALFADVDERAVRETLLEIGAET